MSVLRQKRLHGVHLIGSLTTDCPPIRNHLALKNLIRIETSRHGQRSWELRTVAGVPIEAFDNFCGSIADLSERTQKRYAEVLSRFLDYLYEVGAFAAPGLTARQLNDAIDAYPQLLRDGSDGLVQRIEARGSPPSDAWLVSVAQALKWERLQRNSFSNTLAAVNKFLVLSEMKRRSRPL